MRALHSFLAVAALGTSCVHMKVPSNVAGDTPLRVENGLTYALCGLYVSFDGGPAAEFSRS